MDISVAFKKLADEMKTILNDRIKQYGFNARPRVRRNTLEGSDLQKSIEIVPLENGVRLSINPYWEFVSRGWERTGRYKGTFSEFVENMNKWVTKNNITIGKLTQTQVVYKLIQSIWIRGIAPRPFMVYTDDGHLDKMIPELETYIDKWFDILFEEIISDIEKYFNQ